jgi:hypothetical protein
MLLKAYTLFDSKTECYVPPFYAKAKGDAIRQITQVVNDKSAKQDFAKYPEDFTLFEIGIFDDSTGQFEPHMANESMGCLVNFKSSDPDVN